jgi:hypothetical protein
VNRLRNTAIDVHQHLWPGPLIEVLRARRDPPRLDGWRLELAVEGEFEVAASDHDVDRRAAQAFEDGFGTVLLSLSSALGIETLPTGEAQELLDAWHEGALALPAPFGVWASAALMAIDPDSLARRLDQGAVGLTLPARALGDRAALGRVAPLLDLLERRDAPLFVHPGVALPPPEGAPSWWAPVVDYVGQMHAAWYAFRAHGRQRHPQLRVVFALLAGLAPLHGERFAARGGTRTVVDPLAFLETSSYGARAIDAMVRVTGIDSIVAGTDRPYATPSPSGLDGAALHAVRDLNPVRLLQPKEVSDDLSVPAVPEP